MATGRPYLDDLGAQGVRSSGPRTISCLRQQPRNRPSGCAANWSALVIEAAASRLPDSLGGSVQAVLLSRYGAIRLTGRPHQQGSATWTARILPRPGRAPSWVSSPFPPAPDVYRIPLPGVLRPPLLGPAQRCEEVGHRPVGLLVEAGYPLAGGDYLSASLPLIRLRAWPM